jgi:A/G-specific adenine glycosylase
MEARPVDASLQGNLLLWFDRTARDLPWRRTRDPWKILVSETMLQQTQVARVLPKYAAFLERFPDVRACAVAPAGDVIRLWDGLGYNRRALALHATARQVLANHGGVFPSAYDELLALPGIGPYTARAVCVFAHEDHHAVVDTNVARIVARAVAGRPLRRLEVQELADGLVPTGDAWRWNQAMLDLGATVCTKRSPRCNECPIAAVCQWRSQGGEDPSIGSSGTSTRQSTFAGSDRQGRGRLVSALRKGAVRQCDLAETMGWPGDVERATRVAATVVAERMAVEADGVLSLPD